MGVDRDRRTCRCSTCSTRGAAADAVADAGALRPARGAGRDAALRRASSPTTRVETHRRDIASAAARATRASSPRSSTPRRATSGRASGSPRRARRRPARRARPPRRLDVVGDARRPAAAGDRRGRAAAAARGHRRPPRAASARGWRGGLWLPECAHAPWLDALLEAGRRARRLRRPHRRARPPTSTCARCASPAGPAARPDRPRDDRARLEPRRLPGRPALSQLPRVHARIATARGATTARRTTRRAAAAAAREHAARLRRARARAGRRRRPVRLRGRHRAARRLVARGAALAGGGARARRRRRACRSPTLDDALTRHEPAPRAAPTCRSRRGARRAT